MTRLFGTSGIRRKAVEFTPDFTRDLGRALGTYSNDRTVAVGRDTRKTGPELERIFTAGLLETGHDVVALGIVPTPTVGVATAMYGTGVMVTASHNPPDYNGFKFFSKDGTYGPAEESMIEGIIGSKSFKAGARGRTSGEDFVGRHINLILKTVGVCDRRTRVVLDCAGGAGSAVTPRLLKEMGCDVVTLNTNQDGVFPHELEPREENLAELSLAVRKAKADIGLVHDGDADRAAAVGRDGKMIEWDSFLSVLAYGLKTVVTTVDASMRIEDVCKKVVRTPVGDVAVADAIRKHNADFGGEPSGTFIFPDVHQYPDGVACVAKAVKLVSSGEFYERLGKIKSYPMTRLKLPCENDRKDEIMEKLKTIINEDYSDLDGIRIARQNGWILLRPSGTEPYMRITAEGRDKKELDAIVDEGRNWLAKAMA
ncbi:MAG: phosphopentomutase/phosphoglucosamine mutase [Candidatus Altiarchaeota archaeon]|nr:phosphopentomutase/phosphoglucosamine mutase [Candidatus Altiarchaeota archaeon]